MKKCPKCKATKPITEFSPVGSRKGGRDIYCRKCKNKTDKQNLQRLREDAINQYGGPTCVNCGETFTKVLVLDHINDDGAQDRKKRGVGKQFLFSLKRDGWPEGLQVMCTNCNSLKSRAPELLEEYAKHRGIK